MISKILDLYESDAKRESVEAILYECEKQGVTDTNQIAYILATVKHETANTMLPIEEYGKGRKRKYGQKVWSNGKPYSDIQTIYFGRGYTQNTWRDNYVKLTKAAKKHGYDWDFEKQPELLLQVKPSAWATVYGMRTGLYTGKKLGDYIGTFMDFVNARRIINSTDKALLIAKYAREFAGILK